MSIPTFKTVLIGLGGTGCRVVDRVYGMLDEELQQYIAVHGFDTDIRDLAELQHLQGHLTQTSDTISIKTCRAVCGENVDSWFPVEDGDGQSVSDSKLLTAGAAQVRAISRLALHYTMQHRAEAFGGLERDITRLFQVEGKQLEGGIRVFIVSTLAGGTGSGIFLQIALYLRDLFQNRLHQEAVFFRGMFMLPDIFVQTRVTTEAEKDPLRANAYACIKELDGLIRKIRLGSQGGNDIELEFMPKQQSKAVLTIPYESCFLFDFENAQSANLGTGSIGLQRYLDQVVSVLHLQLASPVGPKNDSLEDNMLREAMAREGRNIYGSAGVAKIVYPYKDILNYCAGKMVEESIQGQWLHIDNLFEEELRRYNDAVKNGEHRAVPQLGRFYIDKFVELGGVGTFHPFFTPLYKETQSSGDEKKSRAFLAALKEEIVRTIDSKQEYAARIQDLKDYPKEERMTDKDSVFNEVRDTERRIEALRSMIMQQLIPETPNSVLYKVMREDIGKEGGLTDQKECRLNFWLLKQDSPMHPVSVRYFLYEMDSLLEKRILELSENNRKLKLSIDNYYKTYDLPETEEFVESAEDRIRMLLDRGILSQLLGRGQFKDFAEEYLAKSTNMKSYLQRYALQKIEQGVYEELRHAIQGLAEHWEKFFRELAGDRRELMHDLLELESKHEHSDDPCTMFIQAQKADKVRLWEKLSLQQQMNSEGMTDLWRSLYCSMYDSFGVSYWQNSSVAVRNKDSKAMKEQLLHWAKDELAENPLIKVPLIRAMQKDDIDIVEALQNTKRRALPMLMPPRDVRETRRLTYWGIHPENLELLTAKEQRDGLQGGQVLSHEIFSSYELVCYSADYGFVAEQLFKFQNNTLEGGKGVYFQAYNRMIKQKTATPHLDKRWHLPAFLADLNSEETSKMDRERESAFVVGLAHGKFAVREEDQQRRWHFYSPGGSSDIIVDGKVVEPGYSDLFTALHYHPDIVQQVNEFHIKQRQQDCKKNGEQFDSHSFISGCMNIGENRTLLDAIILMANENSSKENLPELQNRIFDAFFELSLEYYKFYWGNRKINTASQQWGAFIYGIIKMSMSLDSMGKEKEHYLRQLKEKKEALLSRLT